MELLVNNKIISLDLPVKDVYQKVWAPVAQENEPMRIIYRMRGLLGDATEEFIENLANKDNEDQDEEEIYKMANVRTSSPQVFTNLFSRNFFVFFYGTTIS
jgi:E3 ubiquitin-protein ligase UBR4